MKRSHKVLLVAGGLLAVCVAIPSRKHAESEPPISYDELMAKIGRPVPPPPSAEPGSSPPASPPVMSRPAYRPPAPPEAASRSRAPTASPRETIPHDACARATPIIRKACPGLADLKIEERCKIAFSSQNVAGVEALGPGVIVNIGAPGPEWFFTMNGSLVAVNGLASGPCPSLPDYHEGVLAARKARSR